MKRIFLTILTTLSVIGYTFGIDAKKEFKKILSYYNKSSLSYEVEAKVYFTSLDKVGYSAGNGKTLKINSDFMSEFNNQLMIYSKKWTLLVDKQMKEIHFYDFPLASNSISIESYLRKIDPIRDSIQFEKSSETSIYYRHKSPAPEYTSAIYEIDKKDSKVVSIQYFYRKQNQGEELPYSLNIRYFNYNKEVNNKKAFELSSYLKKEKGKWNATGSFSNYYVNKIEKPSNIK